MKKKLNYWQVHLNKKPKRKNRKRRFISSIGARLAMHQANMAVQVGIIQAQPFQEYKHRAQEIIDLINNSCITVIEMCKAEKQNRFKQTKRYIK